MRLFLGHHEFVFHPNQKYKTRTYPKRHTHTHSSTQAEISNRFIYCKYIWGAYHMFSLNICFCGPFQLLETVVFVVGIWCFNLIKYQLMDLFHMSAPRAGQINGPHTNPITYGFVLILYEVVCMCMHLDLVWRLKCM